MYKILVDGQIFCDSRVDDLAIIDPVITLAMNSAGSFVFTLPPEHPKYDLLKRKKSIVSVWRDDDEEPIFQGVVCAEDVDMFKQKKITCEGELSYFNDSVLRPARYQNVTPLSLLTSYINQHNAQVEESKRFAVGNVTVSGNINCYTNMQSTMTEIKEDLIDDFGGYMRVRYADGHKYIDYLADAPHTAMQPIELGKNLTDYKSNIDDVDIATRVVPLGQTIEGDSGIPGLEVHLTIESVNGGKDYLQSDAAIAQFGIITKTIEFSDVTTPSILKTKGQQYLDEVQFENVVIEASAVDFGYVSDEIRKFRIMDYVHVISEAHGMNKWFILTKMTINLNNPENDRFTLGKSEKLSLSARTTNISADISRALSGTVTSSAMQQAIAQATAMITGANGGFVKFNYDSNGEPYEILIMDTDDVKTAKKVWRWNQNGFGYSSKGYAGPYGTAITMDGAIVADYITTGTFDAEKAEIKNMSADSINTGTLNGIKVLTGNPNGWRAEMDNGNVNIYGRRNGQTDYSESGFLGAVNGTSTTAMALILEDSDALDLGIKTSNGGIIVYYFLNNGENPNGKTERHYFRESMRVTGSLSLEGFLKCNTIEANGAYNDELYLKAGSLYMLRSDGVYAKGKTETVWVTTSDGNARGLQFVNGIFVG